MHLNFFLSFQFLDLSLLKILVVKIFIQHIDTHQYK